MTPNLPMPNGSASCHMEAGAVYHRFRLSDFCCALARVFAIIKNKKVNILFSRLLLLIAWVLINSRAGILNNLSIGYWP